jgi:hypothetical protein
VTNKKGGRKSMGEATYYTKILFKDEKTAEEKFSGIKEFFLEGTKAYEYWQANRGKKREDFWAEFTQKFPLTSEYLDSLSRKFIGEDNNNALAGILDFGDEDDVEDNLKLDGNEIRYHAEVWHFADWTGFMHYIKKKFNAKACKYISDEYVNPYDCL